MSFRAGLPPAAPSVLDDVVDYRSVNLEWLVNFTKKVLVKKEIAPYTELLVATEDHGVEGEGFFVSKGDTVCIWQGDGEHAYEVTKPYGKVRKGEVPKSIMRPKPREEWTTEDVCEYAVKPPCMSKQSTYLELIMPRKAVSNKSFKGAFVSQARKCRFQELVDTLVHFFTLKGQTTAKQFVWLDIFCINQPKVTAEDKNVYVRKYIDKQLTTGLHKAIEKFDQRLVVLDKWDTPVALTRAWCVWEIFGVAKAKMELEIAVPAAEYDEFLGVILESTFKVLNKISKLDVERAECVSDSDLERIHEAIKAESSFKEVNEVVLSQIRYWVAITAEDELDKEEAKPSEEQDKDRIGRLQDAVAALRRYRIMGAPRPKIDLKTVSKSAKLL